MPVRVVLQQSLNYNEASTYSSRKKKNGILSKHSFLRRKYFYVTPFTGDPQLTHDGGHTVPFTGPSNEGHWLKKEWRSYSKFHWRLLVEKGLRSYCTFQRRSLAEVILYISMEIVGKKKIEVLLYHLLEVVG